MSETSTGALLDPNAQTTPAPPVSPVVRVLRPILAGGLTVASLAWAADLYRMAGMLLYTEQFLAAMLGVSLCLVYLHYPAKRGTTRGHLPWYDALAAAAGLAAGWYVAFVYPDLVNRLIDKPLDATIVSIVFFVLCIEGLRRTSGNVLVAIVLVLVGYALIGDLIPGRFQTRHLPVQNLLLYLSLDTNGLFGFALSVACTIVFAYVYFGQLLGRSGGSDCFNDVALSLMGRYRGGSAKIAITASSLFGTISGLAASNILATGVVTIPMMKKSGYPPHTASAIEAVASTGGQIMPPVMGAVAFIMADFLAVPYSAVVLAALIPAVLYYVALFIIADLEAAKLGITRVEEALIPSFFRTIKDGWPFFLPIVVLVYALFELNVEAETAALYACGSVIAITWVFGYKGKRMPVRDLFDSLVTTGIGILDVMMIVAAAGFILGVLNISGIGFLLTVSLVALGQNSLPALLVIAAVLCIFLGMGMPTIGIYILVAVVFAPSLVKLGVDPMAAHLFVFYFGMMSLVTPPVAIAAFFAANIGGADPMRTGWSATRLGWTAYIVPFLFVYSPSLLLKGSPIDVTIAVATAIGGVWLVSVALTGYFMRPLATMRFGFGAAGLLLMIPGGIAWWGPWTDVVGLVAGVALVAYEITAARAARRALSARIAP
jgi:TRAP transporter 4TM/12TM fusion protein